uniref:BUD13 homolog n=1 Tax=Caenorhabditis tropicalis TaxID=1561998 RepID=A0A1I7U4Y4_9PELO
MSDQYDAKQGERKRSRSRKPTPNRSTIDNRPPWNNDTYIEGYEDVDEHGKFRKRGGGMPKRSDAQVRETRLVSL